MSRSINLYDETQPLLPAALRADGVTAITVGKGSLFSHVVIRNILTFLLVNDGRNKNVHIQSQKKGDNACEELTEGKKTEGDLKHTLLISLNGFRLINKTWTDVFDQHFNAPFVLARAYATLLAYNRKNELDCELPIVDMPVMLREGEWNNKKYSPVLLASVGQVQQDVSILKNATFEEWVRSLERRLTTVGAASSLLKTRLTTNEEKMGKLSVADHQTRLSGLQKIVGLYETRWQICLWRTVIACLSGVGAFFDFGVLISFDKPSIPRSEAVVIVLFLTLSIPLMLLMCLCGITFLPSRRPDTGPACPENGPVFCESEEILCKKTINFQKPIDIFSGKMPVVNASHLQTTNAFFGFFDEGKKVDWHERLCPTTARAISDENKPSAEAAAPTL